MSDAPPRPTSAKMAEVAMMVETMFGPMQQNVGRRMVFVYTDPEDPDASYNTYLSNTVLNTEIPHAWQN